MTLRDRVNRIGDRQLAALVGLALFGIAGWPLLFLRVPPYQDYPDHLATVCVLLDPARYPEFVSNGWLRSGTLFFGLLLALSKAVGVLDGGRVACALVIGAMAFTLPFFVLELTDRKRMLVAALFAGPMVHGWFVLMGMLAFALALPIALGLFVVLARRIDRPSTSNGAGAAALAVLLWLCHPVALLSVGLLAAVEAVRRATWRERLSIAWRLAGPFAPVALLIAARGLTRASVPSQYAELHNALAVAYEGNVKLIYGLWAHEFYALTPLSAGSLGLALVLAGFALSAGRMRLPFFSGWGIGLLVAIYALAPHTVPFVGGYVNDRALPFLWFGALLRVPRRMPAWCTALAAVSASSWTIGLGADLFRAEADLDAFASAAPVLPAGARLLTLNFAPRLSSRNTFSLLHASGMYTVLRGIRPQDAWADSASMPIRYAKAPAFFEDPISIRGLVDSAPSPQIYCSMIEATGIHDVDCAAHWRSVWIGFWKGAEPAYEWVLLWGAPDEVRALLPTSYALRMKRGMLELFARRPDLS